MTTTEDLPAIVDRLQELYETSVRELKSALKAYLETGLRPSIEDRLRDLTEITGGVAQIARVRVFAQRLEVELSERAGPDRVGIHERAGATGDVARPRVVKQIALGRRLAGRADRPR